MPNAWVTLATNDGYAVGALTLAHSLRQSGTVHDLHILYTEGVSTPLRNQLHAVFTSTTLVNILDSNDQENLTLIGRPDLGLTFTKLHAWRLTQFEKCVFLDADTLVLKNADELFERPDFSAAPDIGWPDFFNSGVFVFTPSLETYRQLVQFGLQEGSFDGGDQGLLNKFYKDWRESDAAHRLPFIYNMTAGAIYSYAAALKRHGEDVKIVHFLGRQKPWHSLKTGVHGNDHWNVWHSIFDQNVKQHLPPHLLVRDFPLVEISSLPTTTSCERAERSEANTSNNRIAEVDGTEDKWQQALGDWERGAPDYAGRDAFDNILSHIQRSL